MVKNKEIEKACSPCQIDQIKEELSLFKFELYQKFDIFRKEVKKLILWILSVIIAILLAVFGYILVLSTASASHVTKAKLYEIENEIQQRYVSRDDFYIVINLHMKKMEQLMTMHKANVPDSMLVDAFENWEWMIGQIYKVTPRSAIFTDQHNYDEVINEIKEYNNIKN